MKHNYTPLRACPICNNKSGNILARLSYALFDDLNIPGTKTLICCDECGILYDDIAFTEKQLQDYYLRNEHYAASNIGGGGGISDDNNERYDRIIDALKPDTDDLILDYGCGQGGFIARCRYRELKAVGIEPSVKSCEVARKSGFPVYESMDVFIAQKPLQRIHAIVFSHVVEHLINPMHLIRLFAQYAKDALVYIEVPDADSYLSPEAVCWEEMHFEHLSHFRQLHLAELARRSGIEILQEDGIPFSKYLHDIRCRVLVGRLSGLLKKPDAIRTSNSYFMSPLPPLTGEDIPQDGHSLALWGVSQYAMLLLGSCPKLAGRVSRLFDNSPAKIGRSIDGITIEPSDKLSTLPNDFNLLIPKSKFLPEMRTQLHSTNFRGTVQII
ncbi:MAG: methyltransferase domain-containing protein [Proteobacteria bacterium]|nr:methyltransferase domain-containing protein [Pseudomonadota bacterium]